MSKELTEKWENGELPINLYYVIDKLGRETIGNDCGLRDMMVDAFNEGNIFIKEVLAPVPSYEEYKKLEKQLAELQTEENNLLNDIVDLNLTIENREKKLAIATKALQYYADGALGGSVARQALKEMKGVK